MNGFPPEANQPVIFEGQELPLSVYFLELLTMIVPDEIPEAIDHWLLKLHYCPPHCRAPGAFVLEACTTLRTVIHVHREQIRRGLKERLPELSSDSIFEEWWHALAIMEGAAKGAADCTWTRKSEVETDNVERMKRYLDSIDPDHQTRKE